MGQAVINRNSKEDRFMQANLTLVAGLNINMCWRRKKFKLETE